MKILNLNPTKSVIKRFYMVLTTLLLSIYVTAQDKKVDVDINTKSGSSDGFFTQPWVWIVGGAVFLLLLVALLRNNSSKN